MFNFFHRLFNPHCQHCIEEAIRLREEIKEDRTYCASCETLTRQLEIANFEKKQLLDRLLEKPAEQVENKVPVQISHPKNIPWRVRQQELEAADRQRARLMKDAPKPQPIVDVVSTAELEKEVVGDV